MPSQMSLEWKSKGDLTTQTEGNVIPEAASFGDGRRGQKPRNTQATRL